LLDADVVSVVGVIVATAEGAMADVGEVVGKVDDATVVGVAVQSRPSLEQEQFAGAVVQICAKMMSAFLLVGAISPGSSAPVS
jgi:hypothetical protein